MKNFIQDKLDYLKYRKGIRDKSKYEEHMAIINPRSDLVLYDPNTRQLFFRFQNGKIYNLDLEARQIVDSVTRFTGKISKNHLFPLFDDCILQTIDYLLIGLSDEKLKSRIRKLISNRDVAYDPETMSSYDAIPDLK